MSKIAVIVPAYNEEKSIAAVVQSIKALGTQHNLAIDAIVVNDCSKDRTADIIAQLDCIALNLPINLGIGGAVQTGFKYAFHHNYDLAVQMDGDGQHPAEELPKLLKTMETEQLDVVIGSRFINKQGFQSTFMRRVGIKYFQWLNRILVGIEITDNTSGFRLINRKALALVTTYYPDEYPEPEAIILYSLKHLKIGETATLMKERQGGVSSISAFHSVYYMLKVSLAILFTFIRLRLEK